MDFDLDDYKRRTGRLEWDDLDLAAAFEAQPLDPDTLRALRYMHDVEYHTVCYLRDLLLTPAHNDPEITAFLSFWVFEEFWHGEALADVLAAHGEQHGHQRIAPMRRGLGRGKTVGPLATAAASSILGEDFIAVHMTWGAINEWSTQAGYASVARKAHHAVLSNLLGRIMKQEGRHIDFYASQAQRRLAASARARRLTRFALRRFWRPVGSGVMPATETSFMIEHLLDGDEGLAMAARIDRRVDRLPGLRGLDLVVGARTSAMGSVPHAVAARPALPVAA